MTAVDNLIKGAIDMHVHFNPDSLIVRRQDALELAQSARDLGMKGLVLKSREFNTVPMAQLANKLVPEVQVFGSITLDNEVGGLNPAGALSAARMGVKVIWMPTITALNSKAKTEKHNGYKLPGEGHSNGSLKPEVKEIFQIAKEFNIVLASGHVSPKETFALAEEARRINFTKMVVTHALQSQLEDVGLTLDEIAQLAKGGAYIEHSFWGWMPTISNWDAKMLADSIKTTGAERCIMSSDFGQFFHPVAPEGLRLFIATMLRKGIDEKEIEIMVKTNPAKLLGLA
jgi:predicted TIM-barrel fold metal-dependent hydrolase